MMRGSEAVAHRDEAQHLSVDQVNAIIGDCLLVEVMPPVWTRAYSRLLTTGETKPGFGKRIG